MPAVSPEQEKLFQIALAMKRGKMKKTKGSPAEKIAKSLPADTIKEFTHE